MTLEELFTEQHRLASLPPGGDPVKTALDRMTIAFAINEKASTAVAVFAFALLAVPLGIKVSRKETTANLGVALALVMAYYFLTVCVSWLDGKPEWRPDLLIWAPVIFFLALGLALLKRMSRV